MKPKFKKGDLVYISNLPQYKSHFPTDQRAVIEEVNGDRYGVIFEKIGYCAWYDPEDLTLLKKSTFPSFKQYVRKMFNEN